jgi:hypothetical protein
MMPYPTEHSARLRDPGKYERFRRENDKGGEGVHFIFGITRGGKAELQAIRFDASKFTPAQARKWLADHGHKPIDFEPASGQPAKASADLLRLTAPVEITAAAGDEKKTPAVQIVAYDGGEMRLPGWGNVVVDLAGADVSGAIPILSAHGEALADIVGQGRATITGNTIHVTGILTDATSAGQQVIALARSGIMPQASIGFAPAKREHISAGATIRVNGRSFTAGESGLLVIRAGKLREISLVPIGASPGTSVSISAKGQRQMSTDNQNTTNDDQIKADGAALLPENQPGLTDFDRVQARWNRETWHDPAGLPRQRAQRVMLEAVAGRIPYEDFERELLRAQLSDTRIALLKTDMPKGPGIRSSGREPAGAVLEAALLCHMGHEALGVKALGADVMQHGREARIHHIMDFVRACLQTDGIEAPLGRDEMIRAAFSTTSLPGVLSNVANKLLADAYRSFPSAARMVARRLSTNDFKTHTGYRLTGDAVLKEMGPAGEIQHGTLGESSYTFSVRTYARMFGLTRQDIINDDLGAFDEIPRMLGRGAAIALEELFWTLVLANTSNFFHADKNNLIDDPLASEGLGVAVETMLKLVDADGHPVNVVPRYLLVPPELKKTADELYRSTTVNTGGAATATQVPNASVFFGLYEPIVSPYLSNENFSGYSATGWYLFGSPSDVAAFGIAYLSGQDGPIVEQVDPPSNVLGIHWRGYQDFGVCQIDPRGAVMSSGDG